LFAGTVNTEQYCGILTVIIAIFIVPCVCCCPCDTRQVYIDPSGNSFKQPVGADCGC
jgi:hypothetical protein